MAVCVLLCALHVYVAFAGVIGKLLCRLMCLSDSTPMLFWKDYRYRVQFGCMRLLSLKSWQFS